MFNSMSQKQRNLGTPCLETLNIQIFEIGNNCSWRELHDSDVPIIITQKIETIIILQH